MGLKPRGGGQLFSSETLQFLADLTANNDREWFDENRQRYEDVVREPALEFIRRMAPHITAISEHYVAIDKKVGGSLMRVHRDVRFSANKTPYKTNIGIQFRHKRGKDVHAPGFYMHVSIEGCFLAVGSWHPDSESLAAYRDRIVQKPREWAAARDDATFNKYFALSGESLTRMPRGYSEDDPHPDDLRRKDLIGVAEIAIDEAMGAGLVDRASARFSAARPLIGFLCKALGAPF